MSKANIAIKPTVSFADTKDDENGEGKIAAISIPSDIEMGQTDEPPAVKPPAMCPPTDEKNRFSNIGRSPKVDISGASANKYFRPSTKRLISTFDLDGDGRLSLDEILVVADELKQRKKKERNYKFIICLMCTAIIALIWAIFGVTFFAANLAKDTTVKQDNVLTRKGGSSALLTGSSPVLQGGDANSPSSLGMATCPQDSHDLGLHNLQGGGLVDGNDLNNGMGDLDDDVGAGDIDTGMGDLDDGASGDLNSDVGAGDIDTGMGDLDDGASGDLNSDTGVGDLDDGASGDLNGGTGQIDFGQQDLGDGSGDLGNDQHDAYDDDHGGNLHDAADLSSDTCDDNGAASLDLKRIIRKTVIKNYESNPKVYNTLESGSMLMKILQDGEELSEERGDNQNIPSNPFYVSINNAEFQCADVQTIESSLRSTGEKTVIVQDVNNICLESSASGAPRAFLCKTNMKIEIIGKRTDDDGNTIFVAKSERNELPSFDDTSTFTCPKFWERDDSPECTCSFRVGFVLTEPMVEILTKIALEYDHGDEAISYLLSQANQEETQDLEPHAVRVISNIPIMVECFDKLLQWNGRVPFSGNSEDMVNLCGEVADKLSSTECYSADSFVTLRQGDETLQRKISDLSVGDNVLSFNQNGEPEFQEIYYIGHTGSAEKDLVAKFIRLHVNNNGMRNKYIDVTPFHLLYASHKRNYMSLDDQQHNNLDCMSVDGVEVCATKAINIEIGDSLWIYDELSSNLIPVEVIQRSFEYNRFRNPMTLNGNIVVDGFCGSSYTFEHGLAHSLTAPVRMIYSTMAENYIKHSIVDSLMCVGFYIARFFTPVISVFQFCSYTLLFGFCVAASFFSWYNT